MKKLLSSVGLLFLVVILFLVIRTVRFTSKRPQPQQAADISLDADQASQRLSQALRFPTISHQDETQFDARPFFELHAYLEEAFPMAHSELRKEIVNQYSLLYSWPGRDQSLKPILLMSHQDVVPVDPETVDDWEFPPFGGEIAGGYIWGRGALDVKSGLMGILEATEVLLRDGFRPRRTVYFSFGHDEEIGGMDGAARLAELLQSRDIQFEYVLDEGGMVVRGVLPGISNPVALIGISEKGYLSLDLTVNTEGGHSSMPPKQTAVGILSKAVTKLEENPFPADLRHTAQLLRYLSPEMTFFQKMAFANLWLFSPLVEKALSGSPETNAAIRTTTAATMFDAGVKDNVLPARATAVANFRILPGESSASVVDYVNKIVSDPRVQVTPMDSGSEPSPVSDIQSNSYRMLENTIHQIAADESLVVAPYLVVGGTDSRYFTRLSQNVYRFLLNDLGPEDLKRVHGTNERISVENYLKVVKLYYQLIRNSDEL